MYIAIRSIRAFKARWPSGKGSVTESRVPGSNPERATGGERGGTARCGAVRCGAVRSVGAGRARRGRGAGSVLFDAAARGRDRCGRDHGRHARLLVGHVCAELCEVAEQRVVDGDVDDLVAGRAELPRDARRALDAGASSTGAGGETRSSSRPRREHQRSRHGLSFEVSSARA